MSRYRKLEVAATAVAIVCGASFLISIEYSYGFECWRFTMRSEQGCGEVGILSIPRSQCWLSNNSHGILWIPPLYVGGSGDPRLVFPYWLLFLLAGVAAFGLHRKAQAKGNGYCVKCGYNLTGNTTGICPECGTKFELKADASTSPRRGDGV